MFRRGIYAIGIISFCLAWCSGLSARNIFDLDDTDMVPATRPTNPAPPKPAITIESDSQATSPAVTTPNTAPVVARLPVPAAAERQKAGKAVAEIYAAEMADASPSAARALAVHLLSDARKTSNPPVDQFVLLFGALQAAEDAKDLPLCFSVIDALAGRFDLDAIRFRTRSAWKTAIKADSVSQTSANCRIGIVLFDQLLASDNFSAASRLIGMLKASAKVDPALNAVVKKRAGNMEQLEAARANVAKDIEKLQASPGDPTANLAVGKFFCLALGTWDRGLPMLASGSDPKLSALAKMDLACPVDADRQRDVGDGWWDAGSTQAGIAKAQAQSRAVHWYRKAAVGDLKGLSRTLIEKRIALDEAAHADERFLSVIDLLSLVHDHAKVVEGTWTPDPDRNGAIKADGSHNARLMIPYEPPEEYDFLAEFTRLGGRDQVFQIFPASNSSLTWMMGAWGQQMRLIVEGRELTAMDDPTCTDSGKSFTSLVKVRHDGVDVFLNGKRVAEYKGPLNDMQALELYALPNPKALGIGVWYGAPTSFTKIELRPVTGAGRVVLADEKR
jgi:hypothetical protein